MSTSLDHVHRFLPARQGSVAEAPTLITLHGTGGDEDQFAFLHDWLEGRWNLLAPRGQVSEYGANRYFRRLAEGVFDVKDLHQRADALASFLHQAAQQYGFRLDRSALIGYSNGANIGGALLLHGLQVPAAALLHAMVPFQPEAPVDLSGVKLFISEGHGDPTMPANHPAEVEALYRGTNAQLELRWYPTGHTLTEPELRDAVAFLQAAVA